MFYYLNGTVSHIESGLAVIDCGGIGFACHTTNTTLASLQIGKPSKVYTYSNIREDAFDIYGFSTYDERSCFEMLLSVTGIGPKVALSILNVLSPDQFSYAIAMQDEKMIMAAPGVGKKVAQRILLELKDKLSTEQRDSVLGVQEIVPQQGNKLSEVTSALSALGYSQTEISSALKGINIQADSVEQIIRAALRAMVSR